LTIDSRDINVAITALLLPIALLYLIHWNGCITLTAQGISINRARELDSVGKSGPIDLEWKDVRTVVLEFDFCWSNLYVSTGKKTYQVETGFFFFSKKGAHKLEQALEEYRHRQCQTAWASDSSVLIRGVMLICIVLFGYLSWVWWSDVLETRQWPSDSNGWFGLVFSPAITGLALFYILFYPQAKKFDDRTGSVLHSDTPKGNFLKSILLSIIFVIWILDMIERHVVKDVPMTSTSYAMMALILVLWIGSLVALNHEFFCRVLPKPVVEIILSLFRPRWYRKYYKEDQKNKKNGKKTKKK